MSVSTAVSRVTGFVRNWAMAYALGVTVFSSSYVVANNIPNMLYELVAGGVISAVFIPIFIERQERAGTDDAWRLASTALNLSAIVLGLVAVVGTVWAEPFVRTQTFRISAQEAEAATYFFRFFAIQVVFYGFGAIVSAVLQSQRKFFSPAAAPIFNNLVVIATLLGFYVPFRDSRPELAVTGLAIGTTLGVLVMVLVQIPSLLRVGWRYTPSLDLAHPAIRKMGRKALPILAYVATNMVALSFRNAYAFEASPSGPAALQYAWMFYQLPYGILAVALATAVFPELSTDADKNDWESYKAHFNKGLRGTAVLIIPMAAMLMVLAGPLVTLYRAGDFRAEDVPVVAGVLAIWAAGLFSFATYMYLLKSFYSLQDTNTPTLTNLVASVVKIGLYAALSTGIAGFAGIGIRGIPAADAIAYTLHSAMLFLLLRSRIGRLGGRATISSVLRVIAASAAGAALAWGVVIATPFLLDIPAGFLIQLLLALSVGLAASFGFSSLLKVPEMSIAAGLVRRALGKLRPEGTGTS